MHAQPRQKLTILHVVKSQPVESHDELPPIRLDARKCSRHVPGIRHVRVPLMELAQQAIHGVVPGFQTDLCEV